MSGERSDGRRARGEQERLDGGVGGRVMMAARALVASGANVNAVDRDGDTPLNCARGRYGHPNPAIEALLLAAGATAV